MDFNRFVVNLKGCDEKNDTENSKVVELFDDLLLLATGTDMTDGLNIIDLNMFLIMTLIQYYHLL
jgi:hypothetical protein